MRRVPATRRRGKLLSARGALLPPDRCRPGTVSAEPALLPAAGRPRGNLPDDGYDDGDNEQPSIGGEPFAPREQQPFYPREQHQPQMQRSTAVPRAAPPQHRRGRRRTAAVLHHRRTSRSSSRRNRRKAATVRMVPTAKWPERPEWFRRLGRPLSACTGGGAATAGRAIMSGSTPARATPREPSGGAERRLSQGSFAGARPSRLRPAACA